MAKAESRQVQGNKHSSGVKGIAEVVDALRQFEIVQTAKVGRIVEQGGTCDAFRLKPRSNDQNNNVITVVFVRTDGCQEVWITFKPSSSGLDEKIRILGNLLKQKYPKFQLKDFPEFQKIQVPEPPVISTVKIPLLQAPVLEPITTPVVLPVETVKGDDMASETETKVVELSQIQADAYRKFVAGSERVDGALYFRGKVADVTNNYTSVINRLKAKGMIVRLQSGRGLGDLVVKEGFEIITTRPPSSIETPTGQPVATPDDNLFKDPKALKNYLLHFLVRDQAGRLRSADDVSAALLALDEIRPVLAELDKHWQVFSELLPLLQ